MNMQLLAQGRIAESHGGHGCSEEDEESWAHSLEKGKIGYGKMGLPHQTEII